MSKSNFMEKTMKKNPLEFKFWWENNLISRFHVNFEIELSLLHIILHYVSLISTYMFYTLVSLWDGNLLAFFTLVTPAATREAETIDDEEFCDQASMAKIALAWSETSRLWTRGMIDRPLAALLRAFLISHLKLFQRLHMYIFRRIFVYNTCVLDGV